MLVISPEPIGSFIVPERYPHAQSRTVPAREPTAKGCPTVSSNPVARRGDVPARLLLALALLSSLGPLSIDMYLPAFTTMADDLATSASAIQLTLTAFLFGLAAGQLVIGPLSDRYGRRMPLLISIAICTLASVGAAASRSVEPMIVFRFIQGFAGAAGVVIGRSVVTDISSGRAAVKAFSVLAAIGSFGPVVAPLLGGALLPGLGWRGVLWVIAGAAAVMTAGVALFIRETMAREQRSTGGIGETLRVARRHLGNRSYVAYLAISAFGFGAVLAYVSASPFVLQNVFGLSSGAFSLAFAGNSVGLILASLVNARLVSRVQPARILEVAQLGMVVVALSLGLTILAGVATVVTVLPMMFLLITAIGFTLSNSGALAMVSVATGTGTAAALLGAIQFGFGALVSPLVGLGGEESATMMVVVISGCALLGFAMLPVARRYPVRFADHRDEPDLAEPLPGH